MEEDAGKQILLLSFLQRLNGTDRKAYVFVIIFIIVQLLLTFLKLEVTPFFLYGMYSEKFRASDTISTVRILVNGKPLQDYNVPLRERYLLETNSVNYSDIKSNNSIDPLRSRIESRFPAIGHFPLYSFLSQRIYNTTEQQRLFRSWLRTKCLGAAGTDTGSVKILRITYSVNPRTLQVNPVKYETLEDL